MEHVDDLVAALARAYGLSELVDSDDDRLVDLVVGVREGLEDRGPVTLSVDGAGVRVDGSTMDDEHGFVAEMARDLDAAGVDSVRFSGGASTRSLLAFLDALRGGAGSGAPERTARELGDGFDGVAVELAGGEPGASGPGDEIASLFGEAGEEPEVGEPDAPEAGPADGEPSETEPEPAVEPEAEPGAELEPEAEPEPSSPETGLMEVADAFLEAPAPERDGLARRLTEQAERRQGEGATEEVADAVVRLASAGQEGTGDPAALKVAREMVTIGVAARVAVRLAGIREEEERERMIEVAGALGSPMAEAVSDALADTSDRAARRAYIDTLVALGEAGVREAESMIEDRRWFVVRNGVSVLGEVGGQRAIEDLTSALGHDDHRVRREAVMALARIGGEDAGDLLVGMVDDSDADVRAAVAMALGVLKVERAVKPLLQRLEKESEEDVQVSIIRALGGLGDPGAVSAIEKRAVASFFSRPPTPLRIAAYKALSDIGTPHAMELLEEAADDKDPEVRETVRGILRSREGGEGGAGAEGAGDEGQEGA